MQSLCRLLKKKFNGFASVIDLFLCFHDVSPGSSDGRFLAVLMSRDVTMGLKTLSEVESLKHK